MCALLTAESGDTDKIAEAIEECKRMKIVVMAPDINKSDVGFTIEKTKHLLMDSQFASDFPQSKTLVTQP
jgi:DNA polymerase-3 subunit alpha